MSKFKEFRVDDVSDAEWLNMTMDTLAKAKGIDLDAYTLAKISSNPLFKSLIERVERLERLDLVEVVRCKDCCHHEDEEPNMVYCPNIVGGWVQNDFFCKDGSREVTE